MTQITITAVNNAAEEKILETAYKISGKLMLSSVKEDIYVYSKIIKFLRVLSDQDSLLTYQEKQQLLQNILYLGNLYI